MNKEKIIKQYDQYINNIIYEIEITEEEKYYNIYIWNELMQKSLNEQIPKKCINIKEFDNKYCELRILEYYLWFKYSTNDNVLSFYIEEYTYSYSLRS